MAIVISLHKRYYYCKVFLLYNLKTHTRKDKDDKSANKGKGCRSTDLLSVFIIYVNIYLLWI